MVLLLALLLMHWHMVVVLIRRRWLLLLSMMTPCVVPTMCGRNIPDSRASSSHPMMMIGVIFLCLISRERCETQKATRRKQTKTRRKCKGEIDVLLFVLLDADDDDDDDDDISFFIW